MVVMHAQKHRIDTYFEDFCAALHVHPIRLLQLESRPRNVAWRPILWTDGGDWAELAIGMLDE